MDKLTKLEYEIKITILTKLRIKIDEIKSSYTRQLLTP